MITLNSNSTSIQTHLPCYLINYKEAGYFPFNKHHNLLGQYLLPKTNPIFLLPQDHPLIMIPSEKIQPHRQELDWRDNEISIDNDIQMFDPKSGPDSSYKNRLSLYFELLIKG